MKGSLERRILILQRQSAKVNRFAQVFLPQKKRFR